MCPCCNYAAKTGENCRSGSRLPTLAGKMPSDDGITLHLGVSLRTWHAPIGASGFAVAIAASLASASAADMALKAHPATPDLPYDWTGFYVGANAGYGWANANTATTGVPGTFDPTPFNGAPQLAAGLATAAPSVSTKPAGFISGGQMGYNFFQRERFVAGIETDIDGALVRKSATGSALSPIPGIPTNQIASTATITNSLDYLATVRGRLGYALVDRMLVYATGGLAIGGVHTNISAVDNALGPSFGITTVLPSNGSASNTLVGWAVGGGAEYALPWKWSAKIEAIYYDLGTSHTNTSVASIETVGGGTGIGSVFASANRTSATHWTGGIVRVGLNYRFN